MAEGGAGSSQNTNKAEDRSYVGALIGRFVSKYHTWREEQHAPQTPEAYDASIGTSQTGTCARIGAMHYEMEKGVRLSKVTGIDSHVFEKRWLSPEDDKWLCFHANFCACHEGGNPEDISYFFTEVTGIKGPQFVRSCVRLSKKSGYSVSNCRFCTGLWHPVGREANFLGRIR